MEAAVEWSKCLTECDLGAGYATSVGSKPRRTVAKIVDFVA